jgi:hypothetical protein
MVPSILQDASACQGAHACPGLHATQVGLLTQW